MAKYAQYFVCFLNVDLFVYLLELWVERNGMVQKALVSYIKVGPKLYAYAVAQVYYFSLLIFRICNR